MPEDPELKGVLMLMGATERWVDKFRLQGDYVYGYDAQGNEIVRVPLKEPIYLRPVYDRQFTVYRHNIT